MKNFVFPDNFTFQQITQAVATLRLKRTANSQRIDWHGTQFDVSIGETTTVLSSRELIKALTNHNVGARDAHQLLTDKGFPASLPSVTSAMSSFRGRQRRGKTIKRTGTPDPHPQQELLDDGSQRIPLNEILHNEHASAIIRMDLMQ